MARISAHVDTDAIRLLDEHSNSPRTLSFDLTDHRVTVSSDGIVEVDDGATVWA